MMKLKQLLLNAFLLILISSCNTSIQKEGDLKLQNIKGNVKSTKVTTYKTVEKFGEIQIGDIEHSIFTVYNENGYKLNEEVEEDGYYLKYIFKYDDNDNKISESYYKAEYSIRKIYLHL